MFDLPPLRDVLEKYDLTPRKSFGQNFILDSNVTDKIARQAKNLSESIIIEIGPGPGGLTRSLLQNGAKKVIAVEKDRRAIKILNELAEFFPETLEIVEADALNMNISELSQGQPCQIIANLPYNIATPLLTKWLKDIFDNPNLIERMVLMFQKEVGDRITAQPSTKAYGRLSILAQWLCQCHTAFDLAPSVFVPPPKVTSSVVIFNPRNDLKDNPQFENVEKITALAFNQRRKMLRSSLKEYCDILSNYDINETDRAENLSVEQFLGVARSIK